MLAELRAFVGAAFKHLDTGKLTYRRLARLFGPAVTVLGEMRGDANASQARNERLAGIV